jgi:hypothetical protein
MLQKQQEFRRNSSTTDTIFILGQIAEKAIEFNKAASLMCLLIRREHLTRDLDVTETCQRVGNTGNSIIKGAG